MANIHAVTDSKSGLGIRNRLRSAGYGGLANFGNSLVRRFTSHSLTPAEEAELADLQNALVSPADSPMTYLDALTLIIHKVNNSAARHDEPKESMILGRWIRQGATPCSGEDECRLTRPYNPAMMERLYRLMGGESGTSQLAAYGLRDAVMQRLRTPLPRPMPPSRSYTTGLPASAPVLPTRSNTGDPEPLMGGRRRTQRRRRQQSRRRQSRRKQSRRN